jgi:NADP-reducing hydrogenase subunit HndD
MLWVKKALIKKRTAGTALFAQKAKGIASRKGAYILLLLWVRARKPEGHDAYVTRKGGIIFMAVSITIDGRSMQAAEGTTVLEAARQAGIRIPTLCHLKGISSIGACRMCLVEDAKSGKLQASCVLPVSEGLSVKTGSPKVLEARRFVLGLMLSDHDRSCLTCKRNRSCELQALASELGVDEIEYEGERTVKTIDELSPSIVRDNNKCILCRRCVAACASTQGVYAIGMQNRGSETQVGSVFEKSLNEVACINCGQCIAACPTGALSEKDATRAVWAALADDSK